LSINFAIIQWIQQPLLLQQQNGDEFWAEKVPFLHYGIVQQESMCIQWKLSWLSHRLLEWAGDCGQQKPLHFPSTKLVTSVKQPDCSSRKVELHYFHGYASFATVVGMKIFSVSELSGIVGAQVMVRLYPMLSTEVLFRLLDWALSKQKLLWPPSVQAWSSGEWLAKLLSWEEACKVFGELAEPNLAMLWLPLRQDCNILFSETTWQCCNFQQLFNCGWILLQQRPPWQLFSYTFEMLTVTWL
jgi:hypothetical protein